MNAGDRKAGAATLIFDWPRPKRLSFVFLGCVAASLLAHAATFFVFQVVYPQRVTIPPSPPRVSLLTASSPENLALLHWIEAEDPALAAAGVSIEPPSIGEAPYQPSYAVPRTGPLGPAEERPEPVRFPPARDPMSLIHGISVKPALPPASASPHPTSVAFSGSLAARVLKRASPFAFPTPSPVPLQSSEWLIGVSDRGEVRFIFLQESCGDPAFDALATDHLKEMSFGVDASPMIWDFARVSWGDDAYRVAGGKRVQAPSQP